MEMTWVPDKDCNVQYWTFKENRAQRDVIAPCTQQLPLFNLELNQTIFFDRTLKDDCKN